MRPFNLMPPMIAALSLLASGALAEPAPAPAPVTSKPLIKGGTIYPPPHSTPVQENCYLQTFKKALKMTGDWDLSHGTACGICKMSC